MGESASKRCFKEFHRLSATPIKNKIRKYPKRITAPIHIDHRAIIKLMSNLKGTNIGISTRVTMNITKDICDVK